VRIACIWFSWCHCHPIMSASAKSRMVYLSDTDSPGWSWTKDRKTIVVVDRYRPYEQILRGRLLCCWNCRQPGDDNKMLVCDTCDKGYHTFCLMPVMTTIPKNGWKCKVGNWYHAAVVTSHVLIELIYLVVKLLFFVEICLSYEWMCFVLCCDHVTSRFVQRSGQDAFLDVLAYEQITDLYLIIRTYVWLGWTHRRQRWHWLDEMLYSSGNRRN